MTGDVRIGISGWRYAVWRGVFYPPKLPQPSELAFAAKNFNSIEINGTHFSLQRAEYFAQWTAETPDDFVFAVKGSRFITHMKKLRDLEGFRRLDQLTRNVEKKLNPLADFAGELCNFHLASRTSRAPYNADVRDWLSHDAAKRAASLYPGDQSEEN